MFDVGFALLACGCSGEYLDIDRTQLKAGVRRVYDQAQAGTKQAQFELGMRYLSGTGVEVDYKKARPLLRRAAMQTGGTIWVYSPPVTKAGAGRVIPLDRGPIQPGLITAQVALESLEESEHCAAR